MPFLFFYTSNNDWSAYFSIFIKTDLLHTKMSCELITRWL